MQINGNVNISGDIAQGTAGNHHLGFGRAVSWGTTGTSFNGGCNVIGTTGNAIQIAAGGGITTNGSITTASNVQALSFTTVPSGYATERFGRSAAPNATGANTVIGQEAGSALTTGTGNVFLGLQAGASCTTGTGNTIVGHQANCAATVQSAIVIGFQASLPAFVVNPVLIGPGSTISHNDCALIGANGSTNKINQFVVGPRMSAFTLSDFSSTSVSRPVGEIQRSWADNTDASRRGQLSLHAYDASGLREGLRIESNGAAARVGIGGAVNANALLNVNGNIIHQPRSVVTLLANGQLEAEFTSNTQLTFRGRGTDGVTRSVSFTLS